MSASVPPPSYNPTPFRVVNPDNSTTRRYGWMPPTTQPTPPPRVESPYQNRPLPPLPQKSPTYPVYSTSSSGPSTSRRPTYTAGHGSSSSSSTDRIQSPLAIDVRYTTTAAQDPRGSSASLRTISYPSAQAPPSVIPARQDSVHRSAFNVDACYLEPPSAQNLRGSLASYSTIPIDWSPNELLRTPLTPSVQTDYAALDVEWDTIFDARKHRVPVLPETWFQDGWELAGVCTNCILFVERSGKKRRVQVYDILRMSIRLVDVKYDAAALSNDGKYLLVTHGKFLTLLNVQNEKVIKKFKVKTLQVRKWCSNSREFCWVDTDGKFWRWSFTSGEDPEVVFRLQASAPMYWLTPLTSSDGSWYAICATEKDRRIGVVHCYPADHGEARIYQKPSAATFINVQVNGMAETAIALLTIGSVNHVELEMQGLGPNSQFRKKGTAELTISQSMKLFPDVFMDIHSNLLVTVISSATAKGSIALIFEPHTAALAAQRRLSSQTGDRIYCGIYGVHIEKNASVFRRLKIHPEGSPEHGAIDAEDALFQTPYRRRTQSIDTLPSIGVSHMSSGSGSGSGSVAVSPRSPYRSMSHATTDMTSVHSRATNATKTKRGGISKYTWGRGTASTATDESWMLEKQREYRWMREEDD